MLIYGYDENTKEYLGSMEAYLDPLESLNKSREIYVIPPNFTTEFPPDIKENEVAIFTEGKWKIVKDYRGFVGFDKKTGEEIVVTSLGELPSNFTKEKPVVVEELRAEIIKNISIEADKERRKIVSYKSIKWSAENWVELSNKLTGAFAKIPLTMEDETVIVDRKELEEAINYFYIRGILLIKRKKQLIEQVSQLRSKKKLQDFKIDFDIEAQIQELMKLSVEELNAVFSGDN